MTNRVRSGRNRSSWRRAGRTFLVALAVASLLGSSSAGRGRKSKRAERPVNPDDLRVVDCLLPGQVRKLGSRQTYLTQRRPVRTTALDCQIRGGEYVAHDRANYATALKVWLAAAEAGDAQAEYYVGEIYEKGLGTEPNYDLAAEWYLRAAEQGHAPAQINLGFLYEQGLGVEADPRKALDWYRQASGVSGVIMLDSELEAIRKELAESHARVADGERAAEELRRELEQEREALEAERSATQRSTERLTSLEKRIGSLTQDLEAREQEVGRLKETQQRYDIAGPTIEVIDTSATRSLTEPTAPTTEIVGRVEAPAGLAEFRVDGSELEVDADGFFRLPSKDGRVVLIAVDLQGKRAELTYPEESRTRAAPVAAGKKKKRKKGRLEFGRYHALIIGNDSYRNLPDLNTPATDAEALAEMLDSRYGFDVTLRLNATYVDVLSAFSELREELDEKDNLLIYYAGHGDVDAVSGLGYWLLSDAERERKINWLSSREISEQLSLIPAKHVLVVADSCYSGALTRSSLARFEGASREERENWLREISGRRSRTALTSGGLKPVLDTGGSGHSIFARVLLDVLGENADVLETQRLWTAVRARVEYQTKIAGREQAPEYAPIRYAGHESGEFFFVPES